MTVDYYECAVCGERFVSEWTEEEAVAEFRQLFGKEPDENTVVICDDCFKDQMRRLKQ